MPKGTPAQRRAHPFDEEVVIPSSSALGSRFAIRVAGLTTSGAAVLALNGITAHRGGSGNALILCPAHSERNPSCSVHLASGKAHCFSCGWAVGDVVALHHALGGFATMGAALADLERRSGCSVPPLRILGSPAASRYGAGQRTTGTPVVVQRWTYVEVGGAPAFEVHRVQFRLPDGTWCTKPGASKPDKIFLATHPGGQPRVLPDRFKGCARRPLYRLESILTVGAATTVYVVEGERSADALAQASHLATTSSGGAMNAHLTDWSPLAGRTIRIWPDNDEPGRRYADDVTRILQRLSPRPRIEVIDVCTLNLPAGGDAADWFQNHEDIP